MHSVLLIGATGMVGGHILDITLEHPDVASVTTIGRRPLERAHDRLRDIAHADFVEMHSLGDALGGVDVAFYCLGAYTGAVPDDQFRVITLDYTVCQGPARA